MKYKHKLGYMALGGLLMLIGMMAMSVLLPNLVAQKADFLTTQAGSNQNDEEDEEHVTTFETIRCNKLMVVDGLGRLAVLLDATDNGGAASLWDNKGKPTISLNSIDNAGRVHLHNNTGQPVIDLRITDNGGTVAVKANKGKGTAILGIGKNNKGFTKTK